MDPVDLTVTFNWVSLGKITLDENMKIKFPKTGSRPGLYRFEINSADGLTYYIGETDQLQRRMQHDRSPGPSQQTNLRLNALLVAHLKEGEEVSLSVVTDDVAVSCSGHEHTVDLSRKTERLLLESAALMTARAAGAPTLNL
jgi:hypothetical protein